MKLAD